MRPRFVFLLSAVVLAGAVIGFGDDGSARGAKGELKLGVKAAKRGYWQEALYRFERADTLKPQDPEILNNLAVALEGVGRYEDARVLYEKALKAAPNDRNLKRNKVFFDEFYTTYIAKPAPGEEAKKGDAADATAKP